MSSYTDTSFVNVNCCRVQTKIHMTTCISNSPIRKVANNLAFYEFPFLPRTWGKLIKLMKLLMFCTKKKYEEVVLADVKMEHFLRKPIKFKYKHTPHWIDQGKKKRMVYILAQSRELWSAKRA